MPQQIRAPDGSVVQFPDGTSDAQIAAAMRKAFGGPTDARMRANTDAAKRAKATPGVVRAFNQSAGFGLSDEIDAAGAALETGANNLFRRATGKPSVGYGMADAYGAVRDAERNTQNIFAREHPVQNTAASIAGLVSAPGAKAAARYVGSATSLGSAAARSAGVGAVYGAASGAGAGEGGKGRVVGAAEGGVVGAALGAATPVVARGAQAVAKRAGAGVAEAATRVSQGVGMQPREPNARQVAKASVGAVEYVRDIAKTAKPGALSANPFEQAGKPITAAEAIGRQGVTQLAAVARRAGKTGDALESTLRQRADAMPERVLSDIHEITGIAPEAVAGDFAAHAKALREAATPLYQQAYAVGAVDSPKLRTLMQRPSMRSAMSRAVSIAQEEGRDPAEIGFDVVSRAGYKSKPITWTERVKVPGGGTRDVQRTQAMPHHTSTDEVVRVNNPTAQTWDYVKRGLDDVLEARRDPVTRRLILDEKGRAELQTLNNLRDELTTLNPAYRAALDAGGEPLRLEEAYRDAAKLMGAGVSERTFAQRFSAFTPAQREAFKGGFLNSVYEGARSGRLRLKDMQQPAFAAKARAVLGDEAASAFLGRLSQEMQLARTGGRMNPGAGSPTMELQAADAEQARAVKDMRGALGTLRQGKPVSAAIQAVASPIAGAYRGMQAPIDQATRDEVGRLLQLSPSELDRLLNTASVLPKRTYNNTGRAVPVLANATGETLGRQ